MIMYPKALISRPGTSANDPDLDVADWLSQRCRVLKEEHLRSCGDTAVTDALIDAVCEQAVDHLIRAMLCSLQSTGMTAQLMGGMTDEQKAEAKQRLAAGQDIRSGAYLMAAIRAAFQEQALNDGQKLKPLTIVKPDGGKDST